MQESDDEPLNRLALLLGPAAIMDSPRCCFQELDGQKDHHVHDENSLRDDSELRTTTARRLAMTFTSYSYAASTSFNLRILYELLPFIAVYLPPFAFAASMKKAADEVAFRISLFAWPLGVSTYQMPHCSGMDDVTMLLRFVPCGYSLVVAVVENK
jgi:hypothetical protein